MDYAPYQKQMTREVAAACRGALAAGAEDVLVKDAHDSARNIDPAGLPRGVRIHRAWSGDPLSMMTGLNQEKFDAVFFTGYHAWAGCPGNPLSHTMNLKNDHVTLNGTMCSEFLLNAYTAGYYGVPVALITGDKALCDFARELIPGITAVPVNEGRGNGVTSIHPDEAVERIEAAAARLCAMPRTAGCPCRSTSTSRWTLSSTTSPTPRASTPARRSRTASSSALTATTGTRCCASAISCSAIERACKNAFGSREPKAFFCTISLEQPRDPARFVHVDILRGGDFGQTGHGHDVAGEGDDEARAR